MTFSKNPVTKDLVVLKNEEAIKQAVKNLVLTQVGERFFNPYLGTNTTSYLFELSTSFAENALIQEIESVLQTNEPRISLSNITVDADEDMNSLNALLNILLLEFPKLQTVDFILVRES